MTPPSTAPENFAEMIREDHLRLAVLLDLIEDELAAGKPLAGRLAQLRNMFDRYAIREEEALTRSRPALLDSHRQGHEHMRALLGQLSDAHDSGGDIGGLLDQVVHMFTGRLMPADAVFTAPATGPSAAP
ncbi:MAG: hemerythrin domain-containing protein [Bacteroidota bacterium]